MRPNATKSGLAKCCPKSMCVKPTDTNVRTRTKIITEPHELYRYLATPGVEVMNLAIASVEVDWLSWKLSAEEYVYNLRHTNEIIGAYVTAGARINQYGFLDRLQENAFCCDTDSVIIKQPSCETWPIATGDNLRYMQSELKISEYNDEFSSVGHKIILTG